MPCQCEKTTFRNYYRYYDTPEGCDVMDKTIVTSRYGAVAGIFISTFDVLFFSHAVGLVPVLKRYASHIVPLAMMGATFSLVANTSLQSRQKDDHWNYFFGGLACGPIAGAYLRNKHAVLLGGLALGVIGMVKKEGVMRDYQFVPPIVPHMGTINGWRRNFTLVTDPLDVLKHTCGKPKEG
ncbi:NADH dehydrogenase [ubiquinone] 1 alpha subcomplex subunit 11-like [Battus philenor]|uniref:NADH dehydrogenase [ubiquinone] 1 alpha subcomplex subunit 11-like n=1 Tax=Battus philenor TaxID=42288 RepID=UPI0035CEB5BD